MKHRLPKSKSIKMSERYVRQWLTYELLFHINSITFKAVFLGKFVCKFNQIDILQATNRVPCDAKSLKERVKRMKFSTLFNNHSVRVKNAKHFHEDLLKIHKRERILVKLIKGEIQFAGV